jgi:protein-tyrosine phosphatase
MPSHDYFSRIRLTTGRRVATVLNDRFEVLFVCHANQCRSAMAERLANRAFADRIGVRGSKLTVSSAGTHARAGVPMHETAAAVLRERRAYADRFGSRLLTPPILASPTLILTATRDQRTACMSMVPSAARRTFTLRQFARLATTVGALSTWSPKRDAMFSTGGIARDSANRRLQALLDEIASVRNRLPSVPPAADDLPDPVHGPIEAFRECADEIQRTIDTLIDVIASPVTDLAPAG